MALSLITGPTIKAGESLSDAVNCKGGDVVRINMPEDWSTASDVLSFQVSTDGTVYRDFYNSDGEEITARAIPGAGVMVPIDALRSAGWLKIRSGTHDNPIPQSDNRVFALTIAAGSAEFPV